MAIFNSRDKAGVIAAPVSKHNAKTPPVSLLCFRLYS